jgi:hypothetical protein
MPLAIGRFKDVPPEILSLARMQPTAIASPAAAPSTRAAALCLVSEGWVHQLGIERRADHSMHESPRVLKRQSI